jgi:hypothetical protein
MIKECVVTVEKILLPMDYGSGEEAQGYGAEIVTMPES